MFPQEEARRNTGNTDEYPQKMAYFKDWIIAEPLAMEKPVPHDDERNVLYYLFNANGKSGMVRGLAVAGVCFPSVNSFTLSEI